MADESSGLSAVATIGAGRGQNATPRHPGSLWLLSFLVVWAGRGGGGAPSDRLGREVRVGIRGSDRIQVRVGLLPGWAYQKTIED